jgi:hypothetical protein
VTSASTGAVLRDPFADEVAAPAPSPVPAD